MMHQDCERILYTEEQLKARIEEIAIALNEDYKDKRPLVVGILKGSIIFYSDLIRKLTMPVELDFMAISSYGASTESTGQILIKKDLTIDIKGKDVIIVEDIVDSGNTLYMLSNHLSTRGANDIKIVALLNKPSRRKVDLEPDYKCFDIEDEFVIGYGMDYAERYRNLPYIGILKRSVYEK